jgi:SAM-dependent methyltransferase
VGKHKNKPIVVPELLKLNLGCSNRKLEGFVNVDIIQTQATDIVCDLRKRWPWENDSVGYVEASHFLEHLDGPERVHFFNELYRVLIKDGKALIITPHHSSSRAYGDLTHKWPPVVEYFWYYLDKGWRSANATHVPLGCDFMVTWGYNINPQWQSRNQETVQFGVNHYREVAWDMIATCTKK